MSISLFSCSSHTCVFDKSVATDEYLMKAAENCNEENIYRLSCSCGKAGSDTQTFTENRGNHDFSAEEISDKYLISEATYESAAFYLYSCKHCGEAGSESFSYGDKLPSTANRRILIFGDSYSTFNGHIPPGYSTWYPNLDVTTAEKTWWGLYAKETNSTIVRNDSWSGSTICYTGYNGSDCSKTSSFIYRYRKLKSNGFFEKKDIDTVFVFGGTNDSWADAPLGQMKFSDWEESDLYYVLPAICYFAHALKTDLPNARIVFIVNSALKPEIEECMVAVAEHYGLDCIVLKNVIKQNNHPTSKGMEIICKQLIDALN
jgi:hypothetical protein